MYNLLFEGSMMNNIFICILASISFLYFILINKRNIIQRLLIVIFHFLIYEFYDRMTF